MEMLLKYDFTDGDTAGSCRRQEVRDKIVSAPSSKPADVHWARIKSSFSFIN